MNIYAFDGTTYSGTSAVTNESGIASFTLAEGSYRFRADLNGTHFWRGEDNTCTTPNCVNDSVTVTKPLTITVVDNDGSAQSGLNVYAFNGTTYAGYSKATNESGEAVFTLPEGEYRFRADFNGTQFWSGTENHCTLPGCESASVSVTKPLAVTVSNSDGMVQSGLNVYAFNGTTYAGYSKVTNESGEAVFTLPAGDYRFRADLNGTHFWSADENHCTLPGCESVDVSVTVPLTVSVVDTDGTPQSGIAVYAFNGTTYMNYSKTTDEYGQAVFTLPQGDYRFRADAGGTQYWSSEENDCTLPGCTAVTVSTSKPVSVTVVDSQGIPQAGLNVYAYDGTTYTGFSKVSDEYGNAVFYLPAGDYRFRADSGGTQFWSAETNTCTLPGCESVIISVTQPVTVTVVDTDGTAQAGLNVYAFDGDTYSNYSKVTDEYGQAVFSLPAGDYHFRADLNGTQFWSADENTCTLPGCITDSVTVTKPVIVTVEGEEGNPYADLNVYAFNSETYAGYSGKTDAGGHVTFTLPQGSYHFRADFDGVQFWSNNENSCTIPGCEEDSVILPGGTGEQEVSIDYTYDALNRLISAEYSNGTAFGYTYDAAGNVLTYAETHYGQTKVTTYTYDAANQLLTASDPSTSSGTEWHYTYDGNGSLIQTNPGTSVANGSTRYTYNTAGYLTKVENYTTEWQTQSEMTYDGLGNRLEVTTYTDGEGNTTRYVLDGGTELTAIGAESATYYLYGLGAIGTLGESWSYMLQDGAGSTRQLVDEEGTVNLSVSYTPWGDTMEVYGSGMLNLGYLGGVYDAGTGLIYMGNGQYYDPSTGRFLTYGMNEGSTNPYTAGSSDPAMMLISPLLLLGLIFGRKKTRTKSDQFIILFMIVLFIGVSMSAFSMTTLNTIFVGDYSSAQMFSAPPNHVDYWPPEEEPYTDTDKYIDYGLPAEYMPTEPYIKAQDYGCTVLVLYIPEPEFDLTFMYWDTYFEFRNLEAHNPKVEYIKQAVIDVGAAFGRVKNSGMTEIENFVIYFKLTPSDPMIFEASACPQCNGYMAITHGAHHIEFNINNLYYKRTENQEGNIMRTQDMADELNIHSIVHELGHAFACTIPTDSSNNAPYSTSFTGDNGKPGGSGNSVWLSNEGFVTGIDYQEGLWRMHGGEVGTVGHHEAIADMFLSWVYECKGFISDPEHKDYEMGVRRRDFMNTMMPRWLDQSKSTYEPYYDIDYSPLNDINNEKYHATNRTLILRYLHEVGLIDLFY